MKRLQPSKLKKTIVATVVLLSSAAFFTNSAIANSEVANSTASDANAVALSGNPYLAYFESAQNTFKDYVVKQFTHYFSISSSILAHLEIKTSIDNPIITNDGNVSFSLIYSFDDDKQIISSYLVKPVNKKINNVAAIATYTAQITNMIGFGDFGDFKTEEAIDTLKLQSDGFLTADGNIYDTSKNTQPYNKNGFDLPTIIVTSQTEDAMSLISLKYTIPTFSYTKVDKNTDSLASDDQNKPKKVKESLSFKNLIASYQHKPVDNIFLSLLGESLIAFDSANFVSKNGTVGIEKFLIQSKGQFNEQNLVDNQSNIKFLSNIDLVDHQYQIDLSTNIALRNIDDKAFNDYMQAELTDNLLSPIGKTKNALKLLEKGFGISITDFKLKLNDKLATGNIVLDIAPTKIVKFQNPANLLKALNNVNLSVDVAINHDILMEVMNVDDEELTQLIAHAKAELTEMGLGDAISDQDSTLKINFSIKQGNIYIQDQLKMPLINLFMNFI